MRSALALGLLITLCTAADAATMHRSVPRARAHQRVTVGAGQHVTAPARFAIPGWTDEQTQDWLDNASRGAHEG
jgi:hypothetical protein